MFGRSKTVNDVLQVFSRAIEDLEQIAQEQDEVATRATLRAQAWNDAHSAAIKEVIRAQSVAAKVQALIS